MRSSWNGVDSKSRFKLIVQNKREGKNSAVNEFIKASKSEVLVLVNADNTLDPLSLKYLLEPLKDGKVGIVGGHPKPVNPKDKVVGFAVYMLWDMHHRLSLIYPKTGELIAFRNLSYTLPTTMQSDEDLIRLDLEKKGYVAAYAADAIVHNKGPVTIGDFIKQRTRVNIGEIYLRRNFDYSVPTWNLKYLFGAYIDFMKANHKSILRTAQAMSLELYCRAYATVYVKMDKGDKKMWSQVGSTKDVKKKD